MTDLVTPQVEADQLIAMQKRAENDSTHTLPDMGGSLSVPLVSTDFRENFLLDIARGRIDLRKGTKQMRAHQVIILLRLDYGGAPHRNPDGQEIPCPHLHVYREGFGDKWAQPIPNDAFTNIENHWQTLEDFLRYCNVTQFPNFQRGLFT